MRPLSLSSFSGSSSSSSSCLVQQLNGVEQLFGRTPHSPLSSLILSPAAKLFLRYIKRQTTRFCKKHPLLQAKLQDIPLPLANSVSLVEQISVYLQWRKQVKETEKREEEEEVFWEILEEGKDGELEQLIHSIYTFFHQLVERQSKVSVNYYYSFHPEAYAFQ